MDDKVAADSEPKSYDYLNASCVCCEFVEDDNSVSVGYSNWLLNSTIDLSKIIKDRETVAINWPKNVEVKPPEKMRKQMKNINVEWEAWNVKIHGEGDWLAMCEARKSLEQTGCAQVNRKERKSLKRISDSSIDRSENPASKNDVNSNKIKKSKKHSNLKKLEGSSLLMDEVLRVKSQLEVSNGERDEEMEKLRKRNQELEEENEQLKSLINSRKYVTEIEKKLRKIRNKVTDMADGENESFNSCASLIEPAVSLVIGKKSELAQFVEAGKTTVLPAVTSISKSEMLTETCNNDNIPMAEKITQLSYDVSKTPPHSPDVVSDDVFFMRCSRNNVRAFLNNAMDASFEKSEMVEGSITGKPANFFAGLPKENVPSRTQLDEKKIQRIREYAKKVFGKEHADISKINTYIGEKCSNERKIQRRLAEQKPE
ncbi:uncharacterized protein LOC135839127 [Planococcus citri]|uniref:uncharacterized protein LOC135839127 n=1 Tax=Planococcus citri TaxID=170843 RepID=UPI0031F8C602